MLFESKIMHFFLYILYIIYYREYIIYERKMPAGHISKLWASIYILQMLDIADQFMALYFCISGDLQDCHYEKISFIIEKLFSDNKWDD